MRLTVFSIVALVFFSLGESKSAQAGLIPVGGQYKVQNTNFPNTFTSRDLTINSQKKAIGGSTSGGLTVTERITSTGASSEWIEWIFEKTAAPIADNSTARWEAKVIDVPVTEPVFFNGLFVYWTIDGQAATGIRSITGLGAPRTNPINPSLGEGYGGFFSPAQGPSSGPLFFDLILTNFGEGMAQGNMNTSRVNGFVLAAHLVAADTFVPVPEPSTFVLAALGGLALVGYGWRRKRCQG